MQIKALWALAPFFLALLLSSCGGAGKSPHQPYGALEIQVEGLRKDELKGLSIQVLGPDNYYTTLTSPALLERLKPGIYQVQFNGYAIGRTLYLPQAFNVLAKVEAGKTTLVQMPYTILPEAYEARLASSTLELSKEDILGGDVERLILRKGLQIDVGTILLFKGSPLQFPEGFLRKVVGQRDVGSAIEVVTEPAPLEEAFERLYINAEKPVSPYEVLAGLAEYKNGRFNLEQAAEAFGVTDLTSQSAYQKLPIFTPSRRGNGQKFSPLGGEEKEFNGSFSVEGCASKEVNPAEVKGCLEFDTSLRVRLLIDLEFLQLKRFKTVADVSLAGKASVKLEFEDGSRRPSSGDRQKVAEVPLGVWPIGAIVLNPEAYAVVAFGNVEWKRKGDGSSSLEIELASFELKKSWTVGFDYQGQQGKFEPIFDDQPLRPAFKLLDNPKPLDTRISLGVQVGVGWEGNLYGLAGPYMEVRVGPSFEVDLACATDPWWLMDFGGSARAGLQAELFNIEVEAGAEADLFTVSLGQGPDNILEVRPRNLEVDAGGKVQFSVIPKEGFPLCMTDKLSLSLEPAPDGLSVSPQVDFSGVNQPIPAHLTATSDANPGERQFNLVVNTGRTERRFDFLVVVNPNPQPAPSFTLSLDPDTLDIAQGDSGQTLLTIVPKGGFTGTVSLSLEKQDGSPAPAGITLSPTQVGVSGTTSKTLEISVDSRVAPGTYRLRLLGQSGSLKAHADFTLQVSGGPGFSMALNPSQLTATTGGSATTTLTINPQNGFSGTVDLSLVQQDGSPAPSGLTLSPTQVSVSGTTSKTLQINVGSGVMPGTYRLRLVGQSGDFQAHADFTLEVGNGPDFSLTLNPAQLTVTAGSSATTTLTITPQNGFSGTVNLSLVQQDGTPAPAGITLSPTSVSVDGSIPITRMLSLYAASSVATGTYELRVKGTSGNLSRTADLTLVISTNNDDDGEGRDIGASWTLRLRSGDLYSLAYGKGIFVAVGSTGLVLTSQDGLAWTTQTSGTNARLKSITYGNGTFVAVGDDGIILTSLNGVNWTIQNSGTNNWLLGVTYGNGTFVAVGRYGTILTSPDGVNWTQQSSGTSNHLFAVAYGNSTFVAVGTGGTILTSPDGVNWTEQSSGADVWLQGVAYGNGTFVAVGDDGTILTSPDGANWTRQNSGTNNWLRGVTFWKNIFIVVGYDAILTSSDGMTWVDRTPNVRDEIDLYTIAYGNDIVVTGGFEGIILTSRDGISWKISAEYADLDSVAYGNGTFVAVGENGIILTSPNGTSWTAQASGTNSDLNGITYGNGTFVAVGDERTILTSTNGVIWTEQAPAAGVWFNSVAYGNGTFVAVGENGIILTSPNGTSWTAQASGTNSDLNGITYGNGTFVAVGENGIILTSPDGASWTQQNSGTSNRFQGVAYGNGTFVAVGDDGTILTSPNGTSWIRRTSGTSKTLYGIAYGNSTFVAVAWDGIILTSP